MCKFVTQAVREYEQWWFNHSAHRYSTIYSIGQLESISTRSVIGFTNDNKRKNVRVTTVAKLTSTSWNELEHTTGD